MKYPFVPRKRPYTTYAVYIGIKMQVSATSYVNVYQAGACTCLEEFGSESKLFLEMNLLIYSLLMFLLQNVNLVIMEFHL